MPCVPDLDLASSEGWGREPGAEWWPSNSFQQVMEEPSANGCPASWKEIPAIGKKSFSTLLLSPRPPTQLCRVRSLSWHLMWQRGGHTAGHRQLNTTYQPLARFLFGSPSASPPPGILPCFPPCHAAAPLLFEETSPTQFLLLHRENFSCASPPPDIPGASECPVIICLLGTSPFGISEELPGTSPFLCPFGGWQRTTQILTFRLWWSMPPPIRRQKCLQLVWVESFLFTVRP